MTSIKTLTALAAGAFALSAFGGVARAQTPYSSQASVPSTCRNAQSQNGYVSAECQTTGGYRWSSIRQVDCRSALTNRNGVLTCSGATATVGELYPETSGGYQTTTPQGPDGVIGALLGAVFGDAFGLQTGQPQDEWSRGRRPLAEGRATLTARIDAGVSDGSISRSEATRLRTDYDGLVQLETRYAADGRVTTQEAADLRERYRLLAQRLEMPGQGQGGSYGWQPLSSRRADFDARVDRALNDRDITRAEATRLRADFQALVQVETSYQRNGLDAREEADLVARYQTLTNRLGDDDSGYGGDRWAEIETRIVAGERSGAINRNEAARLRTELGDLTRLDAAYRADGLNTDERQYLDRRFGELDTRVRAGRR